MNRRQFNTYIFLFLIFGCGKPKSEDDSDNNTKSGSCTSGNFLNASVGSNHGHSMTIPMSDIVNETSKTYTISGGGHTHTITLSVSDIMTLKENLTITSVSSNSGHSHVVTITCIAS